MMDRVIFGDNQFFGVNHMSEQQAMRQAIRFNNADSIFELLRFVNEIGINSFMFTTHHQLEPVLDKISGDSSFNDFNLIPCMPYAHKYANAISEHGFLGALEKYAPGSKLVSGIKGFGSIITKNPIPAMKLLVDSEMKLLEKTKSKLFFYRILQPTFYSGWEWKIYFANFPTTYPKNIKFELVTSL